MNYPIGEVVLEADTEQTGLASRLRAWAREEGVPVRVAGPDDRPDHAAPDLGIGTSKQSLRVTRHRGAVLKPCTGRTDSLLCCNLHVITQTVGCPLDCSYCILQDYHNRASIRIHAEPEEILSRLARELDDRAPGPLLRICTGQVADSLALEPMVGFAAAAVHKLASRADAVLELKTKTDNVAPLLGLDHGGRTIVSWSLAPDDVVRREEHRCASLDARLAAARRVAGEGYLVAFHLDPMISDEGERRRHVEVARRAFDAVPPDRVAYISMGTVRFLPAMRRTLTSRFPDSRAPLGELLPDVDGKLRLLAPRRVALYRAVAETVRDLAPEVFVYLCMEPPRIWRRALGVELPDRHAVEEAMSRSLKRRFRL